VEAADEEVVEGEEQRRSRRIAGRRLAGGSAGRSEGKSFSFFYANLGGPGEYAGRVGCGNRMYLPEEKVHSTTFMYKWCSDFNPHLENQTFTTH
jgi:hypothetical protein